MSDPVTIVIPHYRAAVLSECLESLYAHCDLPIRVLVVDDGGNAPSLQRAAACFPQIEVLRNERRLWFAGSCNRGLAAVTTPYAVLLNDDTRVTPGWLGPLVAACQADSRTAACQPKLLSAVDPGYFDYGGGAGGYIDRFGYTFCRGRLFDHREADQGQYDHPVPLFWACGSALFLRTSAARQVGLLDVDFFMHFEEIDLCWRLRLAGYRIWAVPQSVVYHHSGFSLPPRSWLKTYLNHRNSLVMLCKNLDPGELAWLLPVRLGLETLAAAAYLLRRPGSATAPLAAGLWLAAHVRQVRRRRRHSRALQSPNGAQGGRLRGEGVYPGSILWQHWVGRRTRASELIDEGTLW
ncbi:MAG: glycosyltransferase family 2 protein [Candidatus Latescibacterota bacterium]